MSLLANTKIWQLEKLETHGGSILDTVTSDTEKEARTIQRPVQKRMKLCLGRNWREESPGRIATTTQPTKNNRLIDSLGNGLKRTQKQTINLPR